MKKLCVFITLCTGVSIISSACPLCNKQVRDAIYNSRFYPNLFTMLSAFIVLAVIVIILSVLTTKKHKARLISNPNILILSPVPLSLASTITGIGMGGFIDGIVLHQILQVHEMLSNKIDATNYIGKSVNMFWDGIFHAFCFIVVLIGIVLLWKLSKRKDVDHSGNLFAGGLLLGWGLFNIVEGIIDHQLLKLHNVIEFSKNHATGNYIFLGISLVMIIIGFALLNRKRSSEINFTAPPVSK